MHEHQQNIRITAARAFRESLDQLQNILAHERQIAESESEGSSDSVSEAGKGSAQVEPLGSGLLRETELPRKRSADPSSTVWPVSEELEEAAADLDAYFGDDT
jgi:hypothetical protein